jgi:hypothetical protein
MNRYKIAFSIKGLIAFLIPMLPNFIWMIFPGINDSLSSNQSNYQILNILMVISQWSMIICICLLETREVIKKNSLYPILCLLCMSVYYVSWVLCYFDLENSLILMAMAIFPTTYFILYTKWQKNYIALVPAMVFALLHITITFFNVF